MHNRIYSNKTFAGIKFHSNQRGGRNQDEQRLQCHLGWKSLAQQAGLTSPLRRGQGPAQVRPAPRTPTPAAPSTASAPTPQQGAIAAASAAGVQYQRDLPALTIRVPASLFYSPALPSPFAAVTSTPEGITHYKCRASGAIRNLKHLKQSE